MFQSFQSREKIFYIIAILILIVIVSTILLTLLSRKKTTSVQFTSAPAQASVAIEGYSKEFTTPFTLEKIPLGSMISFTISKEKYKTQSREITITESPTHTVAVTLEQISQPADKEPHNISEGLRIEQNPKYLEKIKREPFWDILPYWDPQRHFKIEYKDSDDYLLITLFAQDQSTTEQYREKARAWLRENGGIIEKLTIRYESRSF